MTNIIETLSNNKIKVLLGLGTLYLINILRKRTTFHVHEGALPDNLANIFSDIFDEEPMRPIFYAGILTFDLQPFIGEIKRIPADNGGFLLFEILGIQEDTLLIRNPHDPEQQTYWCYFTRDTSEANINYYKTVVDKTKEDLDLDQE